MAPTTMPGMPGEDVKGTSEWTATSTYFTKTLELYEITNHIMASHMPVYSSFTDALGLPRLYPNHDYLSTAVKLDGSLDRWKRNLSSGFELDLAPGSKSHFSLSQRVLLRLR